MRRVRLALALFMLSLAFASTPAADPEARAVEAAPPPDAGWPARAQQGLAEREYRASETSAGLQAPNRAHNLRTYFEKAGIRVHDRSAGGSPELLRLWLSGVGRGEKLAAVPPGEAVEVAESRVEIRRPGLVEWYVNSAAGLEQGFTFAERPAGDGPLVLELAVAGAKSRLRGEAIVFETGTQRRLRYGELVAADAAGRTLAARFEVPAPERLRIVVEDADATYPLVIDPLLTETADTQLESNQESAGFGLSVAGAGDVNGDGYADVIVGALWYDAGETNEGAAFVFHGSASGLANGTPATAAAQLESDQAGAQLGDSVAGAGDVNGDGYADVIVHAWCVGQTSGVTGVAFVFHGSASGIADGTPATAATQLEGQGPSYGGIYSVAGAGDVNGDGYADVIVEASFYPSAEGAAFVFHGSATGIADATLATAATEIESDQASSERVSVAGAGDVNGDGYADVIVGASRYDDGQLDEGAAFVFYGSATGIADGNPATAAAQLESNQANALLGWSVAGAGDVNGDGYGDVILGAIFYDAGQTDEGAAFVFLGSASGIADGNPATAAAQLESDQGGAQLSDVARAGDVNGDGYADVIVGAPWYTNGQSLEGAAFVFLGSTSGIADGNPATAAAQLESDQVLAYLGGAVAGAGDVNGDGYADVIVGANLYDAGQADGGAAFVYLGGAQGIADGNPSTAAAQLESDQGFAQLGESVAGAGDVNGDGYTDVIVGARFYDDGQTDEGAAFVFLGSAAGIADGTPASAATQLESDQASARLGQSVAGAGDVNGDGYADVIVGAYAYDNGQTDEGAAFVFLGSPAGIADGSPASAAAQLESDQVGANFGYSVAGAGDVNGDGYADVIVGAQGYDAGQANEGAAFVFLGSASGIADATAATAAAQLESDQASAFLGRAVAGAGDVNGDGYADVIVGAQGYDAGQGLGEGAAFVFLGSAAGIVDATAATAAAQLESDQAGAELGWSVAGAGDVNGDGYAEVIVGAPGYDAGQANEGAAFVFLGSATGIADGTPATAAAQLESDQAQARLGGGVLSSSVAGAGDVNGDGYADVIVGAALYNGDDGLDEGAAFVFLGGATGIADGNPTTAAAQLESDQAEGNLGASVAGAGDVNGDGYADVIVGAPGYVVSYTDEGTAFVFLGNGDGDGRPVLTRQLRSAVDTPIQPWGRTYSKHVFRVRMQATHPEGRGRVKLRVEYCPPGVAFGHASCGSKVGASWTDVTATSGGVTLTETVSGLVNNTNYRWRARVQYAPFRVTQAGITAPPQPAHGPWRRLQGQALGADLRTRKSGGSCGLGFELAPALALLAARRRRRERARGHRVAAVAALILPLSLSGLAATSPASAEAPGVAKAEPAPQSASEPAALPTGTGNDWWAIAQRHLAEREYRASESGAGLQAPNRAHNLRTWFEKAGIRVHDRSAGGSPELLRLSLAGVGRGAVLAAVAPGEAVEVAESRVEIRRPGLVEWYVNSAAGLEQGFTLAERPAGEGPLVLEFAVAGAKARLRGEAIVFETGAQRKLRYGELAAADAGGRKIAARFEVPASDRLRIVVDDASGTYPLVIDPLLTETADTQLESDQAGARLGGSVAGAGDVNGDGYADVIVGAYQYDAGEANEGAAFVFLGSAAGIADATPATAAAQLESDQADANLGTSVAGAGDVNGDGYADVIVGGPNYDAGQTNEGAAFVFLGSATGIADGNPATAAAQLESDQACVGFPFCGLGGSVAGAGDVNGDGYADVIVGAYRYDAGLPGEGAAFVFLGSAMGIADGNPATAAAQLESDQANAFLGISVAGAGDVNGDGYADVIVGAYLYDAGQMDEGAAFVFLGSAAGIADGNPATAAAQLESDQAPAQLGWSVAGAGDVNGDGYADVIVGAYLYDAGLAGEGAAFVFLGSGTGIADGNPATAAAQLESNQMNAALGWSVAGAGDVNGDGYSDVIVGAYLYDAGQTDEGAAFVFLGSGTGIADGTPATAAAQLESDQASAQLGRSVAGAGEVNGDGYADVIVGADLYDDVDANEGAAFVYLGGAEAIVDGDPMTAAAQLESDQGYALLGSSVAGAGDVNGDGYTDVIVGAPYYDAGQGFGEGAAFVFLGSASGVADGTPATAAAQLESDQGYALLGWSVAGAGDVNGDGYAEVIVGARGYDAGQANEGAAFVFLGSATGIADGTPATAAAQLESDQMQANLGVSVAGAGDVNGDGYADVVVGAYLYDAGLAGEGAAFVFLGSATGIADGNPATAAAQLESNQMNASLGWRVAGAGDVNGDGYADVIVGSLFYAAGQAEEGAAFVFLGSATGIADGNPATAATLLESDQASANLGVSVAGAGDVNGDGYADVIAGAWRYDAKGAAFVFLGSVSGIPHGTPGTAAAQLESNQSDAHFGYSIAGAGDMNGDGYADVIVGSPLYDAGQTDEGAAFVFLGSASGIAHGNPTTAATQLESDQASAALGGSVAGAGDVNGDGTADVIVAAAFGLPLLSLAYDSPLSDEGAAFVFLGNGDGDGRPVLARQLRASVDRPIEPWGRAHSKHVFRVRMQATHPEGRGRVKLRVEYCPPGVAFGHASCGSKVGASWTDVTATSGGVTLTESVTALVNNTNYRWRARVQYAPFRVTQAGITAPPQPAHGPWRRLQGQALGADLRTKKSGGSCGLGFELAPALALLAARRRRLPPGAACGLSGALAAEGSVRAPRAPA